MIFDETFNVVKKKVRAEKFYKLRFLKLTIFFIEEDKGNLLVSLKTSPKGLSASKCNVGNCKFSKSWDFFFWNLWEFFGNFWVIFYFFANFLGILWEFFGKSLGILWEFFGNHYFSVKIRHQTRDGKGQSLFFSYNFLF